MSEIIGKDNRKEGRRIRRADICLMAFFLLLALGSFAWAALSRKEGQSLRISCDGAVIEEVTLAQRERHDPEGTARGSASEPVRYCLLLYVNGRASCQWYGDRPDLAAAVPEGNSYNLLAVSGAQVWMEAADCRDQICVYHIPIAGGGKSIICLPHKLAVEIVGEADAEAPDGMAKAERTEGETGSDNGTFRNGGGYETDG